MKILLGVVILVNGYLAHAKLLQVPENCIQEKNAPCLVQVQSDEEQMQVNNLFVRATSETIIKWANFKDAVEFEIVKGKIEYKLAKVKKSLKKQSHDPHGHGEESSSENSETEYKQLTINSIPLKYLSAFVEKNGNQLNLLELNTFMHSTYNLSEAKDNATLQQQERFLDKFEFVQFSALFFKSKNKFNRFLATVQKSWLAQYNAQAKSQAKVLERSLASIQEENERERQKQIKKENELKKVREQFFYRTFYR